MTYACVCLSFFAEVSLQAQLAECQAQVEHWQGVATICELSKQEELAELQKQCDQEIQSLQEALRGQCIVQNMAKSCKYLYFFIYFLKCAQAQERPAVMKIVFLVF